MARLSSLAIVGIGVFLAACSADVDDVFGTSSDSGSGGAGSQQSSSSNPNQTVTTSGETTSGPSTSSTMTTDAVTSTTSGPSTTTTTGETTTTTVTDAVVSSSSGGPGDTVDCDGMPCSTDNGGVCCWVDKGDFGNGSASCAPNASACSDPILIATDIACQLPSQCPGQICCAHRASQNVNEYGYTACQDDCPYPDRYLCDINNPDCPTYTDQNGNPIQSFCKPSTLLPPGYYVCGFN